MRNAGEVNEGAAASRAELLIGLLADVEPLMARLAPDDLYGLSRLLHETASRAAPVEAFYVCRYESRAESLNFLFNFDEGVYDYPVAVPLGQGPTSQVVRTGQPFVFPEPGTTRDVQDGGIDFGNLSRVSESALHPPIWSGADGDPTLWGVVSAQSYQQGAFDGAFAAFLNCLARRAGFVLTVWNARRESDGQLRQARQGLQDMARQQVETLRTLTSEAEAVEKQLPTELRESKLALRRLCQTCYRLQTETNLRPLLPPQTPPGTPAPASPAPPPDPLKDLTARQKEVAALVAQGLSNKEISDHLVVSEDTIKSHVSVILSKLELSKRGQIAPHLMRKNSR